MDAWFRIHRRRLLAGDPATIGQAHERLLRKGFFLVGFHGCGAADAISIVPDGFDSKQMGQQAGAAGELVRGQGFYVAASHGDIIRLFSNIRASKPGMGAPTVLRIYARRFPFMKRGVDYEWGVMEGMELGELTYAELHRSIDALLKDDDVIPVDPSGGVFADIARDYNRDRRKARAREFIGQLKAIMEEPTDFNNEIEIVFRPHRYKDLLAIPSLGKEDGRLIDTSRLLRQRMNRPKSKGRQKNDLMAKMKRVVKESPW